MPGTTNKVDDPCEECRNRHLKCDDKRPKCSQCERTGQKCCRTKGQRRFRDGSSAQYEKKFTKDQVWLGFTKNAKIQIVDQSAELENYYSIEDPRPLSATERPASGPKLPSSIDSTTSFVVQPRREAVSHSPDQRDSTRVELSPSSLNNNSPASIDNILSFPTSTSKRRRTSDSYTASDTGYRIQVPSVAQDLPPPLPTLQSPTNSNYNNPYYINNWASPTEVYETKRIEAEYAKIADKDAGAIPAEPLLSASSWKKSFRWPNQFTTQQCMCLMKYYIETLGPWFDIGDTQRHFTSIVPHRARRSPPLLNAIFSAAAIHLRYTSRLKSPGKTIQYGGFDLTALNKVSEIKYYQATTAYLRALCGENKHAQDEDLLAATVIIRFYEDFEELIKEGTERDRTLNVRPFQLFVTEQARPNFLDNAYEQYDFRVRGCFAGVRAHAELYLRSYQHSSFRIALRQECQRALLSREKIKLPLEAWKLLEGLDEAEDSVWADRHLYHYANVLQFCFSNGEMAAERMQQRWQELKEFEIRWEEERPLSFSHYMKQEPNREEGEVFPQIWYVSEVNAAGMIYYQFARILLNIYDPESSRPGIGSAARQRKMSEKVREIVIQLCGIAKSTSSTHPVLVQAQSAIVMFGEHFFVRRDQQALLEVLEEIQVKHGWPISDDVKKLRTEWGW